MRGHKHLLGSFARGSERFVPVGSLYQFQGTPLQGHTRSGRSTGISTGGYGQRFLSWRIDSKTTERLGLMSEIVPSRLGLAPFLIRSITSRTLRDGSMAKSFA